MDTTSFNTSDILIVDDNPINARLLSYWCTKWDYTSDQVFTGVDALEKALNSNYKLIIMDILLPDISGIEVSRELANQKSNVDIIFQSGLSEGEFRIQDEGAHFFLQKPYYPSQMGEVVDFIFQKHTVKMLA